MKLICDACAYTYEMDESKLGETDWVCSEKVKGTLREPTKAELVLLARVGDWNKVADARGEIITDLRNQVAVLDRKLDAALAGSLKLDSEVFDSVIAAGNLMRLRLPDATFACEQWDERLAKLMAPREALT